MAKRSTLRNAQQKFIPLILNLGLIVSSGSLFAEGGSYYDVLTGDRPGAGQALATGNPDAVPEMLNQPNQSAQGTQQANNQAQGAQRAQQANQKKSSQKKKKTKKAPTFRDRAFQQLLNQTIPLTPEQIIKLRREMDKSQRAIHTHPTKPPQPVSSTLTLDLSPGSTPPVIRLAAGFVTSMVFVDATGQPWPVGDFSLGNPQDFNIQWDQKTNTLFIQSTTPYITGNLAVRLAQLDTPVVISLVTGQKEVDYRVDLQVRAEGPNALPRIVGDNLPGTPNSTLLSVLDGVPPPNSHELKVPHGLGRAWSWDGKIIFRSKLNVLSPAWSGKVSSLDGTHVYEMMPTPMILASLDGKPVKIYLEGL